MPTSYCHMILIYELFPSSAGRRSRKTRFFDQKQYFTLPAAETLSGKNSRAWVLVFLYQKRKFETEILK